MCGRILRIASIAAALGCLLPAFAASPVPLADVAPVEELVAEIDAKLARLEEFVKDDASFQAATESGRFGQAAGVIACLAQAVVEHAGRERLSLSAAHVRDAAISLGKSSTRAEASSALENTRRARNGQHAGDARDEHAWDQLIDTHHLMEEVNTRFAQLRRPLRNLKRGRQVDVEEVSRDATTLAVLALVIHADDGSVGDEAQRPEWQTLSTGFQQDMTALAAAVKQKEVDEADERFRSGAKSCTECHRIFRD